MSVLVSIGLAECAFICPIPKNKSIVKQNDVAVIVDPGDVEFDPQPPRHRSKTCPRTHVDGFICEVSLHATAEIVGLDLRFWGPHDALLEEAFNKDQRQTFSQMC